MQKLLSVSGVLSYTPEVSGVIESIAFKESRLAARSRMERDDLRQEIRMACIRALVQFDASRIGPSPYIFLLRCAQNHVYNLNRGTLVPNNPPCTRCPLWDKKNKLCTINEIGCDKIVEYRKNMQTKASIKHADNLGDQDTATLFHQGNQDAIALYTSIKDVMPKSLLPDLEKILSGRIKEVSAKKKAQIRKIVRDLLEDDAD